MSDVALDKSVAIRVWVMDMGSQTTQLVARRVREAGVYAEVKPWYTPVSDIIEAAPSAIIISGGPASIRLPDSVMPDLSAGEGPPVPQFSKEFWDLEIPMLGICYGMQAMAMAYGGEVKACTSAEYGPSLLTPTSERGVFHGIGEEQQVWMSHRDQVATLPAHFSCLASTATCPVAAFAHTEKARVGVQFHPEVMHSVNGKQLIANFLTRVARLEPSWSLNAWLDGAVQAVKDQVGATGRVVMAVSGGVDSSVAAAVVHRAVGDRLIPIFVDNGLLRKDEAYEAMSLLNATLGLNAEKVDAASLFYEGLKGVTDPERKRKIIGKLFIDTFVGATKGKAGIGYLGQGTLYPDVIESVAVHGGPTATIKSHHNVGGLPDDLPWQLIEPLRMLFKDEVRQIGRELGLDRAALERQPFPGPGLAVRIVGEVTPERVTMLQSADAIIRSHFDPWVASGAAPENIWQWFGVLLPVRSVGVIGDARVYGETVAIRAVSSVDAMTAEWVYPPRALLQRISSEIVNTVPGINRVVLDISTKPPATIEWE